MDPGPWPQIPTILPGLPGTSLIIGFYQHSCILNLSMSELNKIEQ